MSHKKDPLVKAAERKAYDRNYQLKNKEKIQKQKSQYYQAHKHEVIRMDRERKRWKSLSKHLILLEQTLSRIEQEKEVYA